ncbi:MAG: sigma-70 family RNA polymerase sigma factor [Planctomycetes bacterium]|nr:sigma-70 family RNA polymerase sigma factor [Planctomycetota bacterium]
MTREEFEPLALEHIDAVYRLAYHLTHSVDLAEDLVQEVYVRAFRPSSIASYDPSHNAMRSWLFAICHNAFFTEAARRKRGMSALPEGESVEDRPTESAELHTAWNRPNIDWDQVDDHLRQFINELRPEYREVLVLWGVEGMKYREIGEVLGVPLGTVMSRLYRARGILARRLEEHRRAQDASRQSGGILRRIGGNSAAWLASVSLGFSGVIALSEIHS